ncbi:MAG TPA: nucleoside hydrolase [Abditibacteriaceae bacterium]|jgi:inosine-uridine nucleoside N-ribohydrolase
MTPQNIILDTDIGDNIDDALALGLAVNSPELHLLGVTTVFRNAPRRAALARHVMNEWGQTSTRVVAGISKPLLQAYDFELGTQFQILQDDVWGDTAHAVDFLIEQARVDEEPDADDPVTIVCIGPLTNIAVALVREPELIPRIRIVLMGGCWSRAEAETNIRSDPEAAAIVFNSGVEISMIGLDVTRRCELSPGHLQQIAVASTRGAQQLQQLIGLWQEGTPRTPVLNDPLAVLSLFDDCITWQDKCIEVALCGEQRGCTLVSDGEPNARVAVDVDAAHAVELCLARLLK